MLRGVRFCADGCNTHSIVMRTRSGTVRLIETEHHFVHKPNYDRDGTMAGSSDGEGSASE